MRRHEGTSAHRCATGLTLVEFVIAVVVIGIGAAVLTSFITPTAASADPMLQAQARTIASAYMDEILLREHATPGDCGGTSRATYETVWCYDGLDEAPRNQFGSAIPALSDYRVRVGVTGGAPAEIAVRVTHASGRLDFTLRSQRGDY